jgi:hypothetical protein
MKKVSEIISLKLICTRFKPRMWMPAANELSGMLSFANPELVTGNQFATSSAYK